MIVDIDLARGLFYPLIILSLCSRYASLLSSNQEVERLCGELEKFQHLFIPSESSNNLKNLCTESNWDKSEPPLGTVAIKD